MANLRSALRSAKRTAITRAVGTLRTSIIAQAQAILRTFGPNASSYPFSTLQGPYQTRAGPAAVAVNDPIGLELDVMGTVGSELVANGDFDDGSTGWFVTGGWTAGGGVAASNGGLLGGVSQTCVEAGKSYVMEFDVVVISGWVVASIGGGGNVAFSTSGHKKLYAPASTIAIRFDTQVDGHSCTITNVSCKEVTGNHATQSTAINRPTVQQDVGGRFYASFNGTNSSLALTSVPFQMDDDFAVVACINPGVQAGNGAIFGITNATATPRIELYIANATGFAAFYLHDDATGTSAASGATDIRNSPCVVTLWKVGNAKYLRVNSVQVATDSTALGTATFTGAAWGCLPVVFADYFNGENYEGEAIKGTLTLAQVVTLEKAAAQRAGLVL